MLKNHSLLLSIFLIVNGNQFALATEKMAPELHVPTLNIDPFVNPLKLQKDEVESGFVNIDNQSIQVVKTTARKTFLWQPELRGIIRSEDIAIANMAGEMVELGMEFEGYRLIKVREQSVVFEKDGRKFPVSLDGTDEEESTL